MDDADALAEPHRADDDEDGAENCSRAHVISCPMVDSLPFTFDTAFAMPRGLLYGSLELQTMGPELQRRREDGSERAFLLVLSSWSSSEQEVGVSTFVLVQPAWMGGWCWNKVASQLQQLGHQVYAPTLTGLAERAHLAGPDVGLSTHIDDVVGVVEFEDLRDVVLVGTSSGGTVITGAADRISDRVVALVYLDAFVPSDGQSTLDLIQPERREALEQLVVREGEGWLLPRFAPPPWPVIVRDMWQVTDDADVDWMLSRLRPTPFRHFTDAVQLTNRSTSSIKRAYVRCPRTRMPGPSPFDPPAALARSSPDWKYIEIDAPHVPYITHPHEVVVTLAEIAAAL